MYINIANISRPTKASYSHSHDCWEICLNIEGCGTNWCNGEKAAFSPGFIYVCPPNIPHYKEASGGCFRDVYCTFSDGGLLSKLKQFYFTDDSNHTIQSLLTMIYKISLEQETGYGETTVLLLEALCRIILTKDASSLLSPAVTMLRDEIIKHFSDPEFKIQEVIEKSNYNGDYIRKLFKSEMGKTPAAYLADIRVENAKKLFRINRHPHYCITEVAGLCGFYDTNYFSRLFRKKPARLLRSMQNPE